ncbi:MAG: chemotaxis protein CheA [Nitrospirales bacterium]|nr:MAG: chemotaxis protein CheA [Nitrospirales bacterium]
MNRMDTAVVEFLIESDDILSHLEKDLVHLEATPNTRLLSSILRAIHTINGASTFLGYTKLESLTYAGETLVNLVRDGECALTSKVASALMEMVGAIRQMLERIEQDGVDGKNDYSELKDLLQALQSKGTESVEVVSDDSIEETCERSMQSEDPVLVDSADVSLVNEPVRSNPELDEAVLEFLSESDESLAQVECDLVGIEKTPSQETLAGIFRVIHTIKGTCSFLGYAKLERLTHVGESLLSLIRDGKLSLTVGRASALLSLVDAIRTMLSSIALYRHDGTDNYEELKAQLSALQKDDSDLSASDLFSVPGCLPSSYSLEFQIDPHASDPAISPPEDRENSRRQPTMRIETTEQTMPVSDEARSHRTRESTIRVDVGLLDSLMATVGELVVTRNQVFQNFGIQQDRTFMATAQRLNIVTAKLQEGLMRTRMQPIGNIWSKFPRVVRDLALACGKEILIEMEGQETEFDKTLLEAIQSPLTHLVRNAVDHGIELPNVRKEKGKPPEGRLFLRAYHESGQAHVEISDDGGGIHTQHVAEMSIARGVVTRAQVARMREKDLLQLIFFPGFSTLSTTTHVSGRGVGLDVVKTNLKKVGGSIDVSTKCEQGTTFKLSVPLTLTIIPALMVQVVQERFAIPQVHLLEYIRVDTELDAHSIECLHGAWGYRWRGQLLPLIYLRTVLNLDSSTTERIPEPHYSDVANIVVLQAGRHRLGVVVDTVDDIEEIVVKPLGKPLKGLDVYAGMTIMGDGRVALILDVMGLTRGANLVFGQNEEFPIVPSEHDQKQATTEKLQSYILTKVGMDGCVAIPVDRAMRIAEVKKHLLEMVEAQEVVQYQHQMVPVVRISSILYMNRKSLSDEREVYQIVFMEKEGKPVGVIVDHISDIVQIPIDVQTSSSRPGILSSAIIQGNVIDLLDVDFVMNTRIDKTSMPLVSECQES